MGSWAVCGRCDKPRASLTEPCPCGSGKFHCASHGDHDDLACPTCAVMSPAEIDAMIARSNERRAWQAWQDAITRVQKAEQAILNERAALDVERLAKAKESA